MRKTTLLLSAMVITVLLLPGMAIAQEGTTAQPVDPPQQVAQLRQQFEGLSAEQVEAQGYVPMHGCISNPEAPGAMGTHAVNQELLQAQFPNGEMDPENPPVVLLDQNGKVVGIEWEAADVGQGPMKMFGQTIELQPGHPGAEEPHYMLHIYFKPDGKVLFGTDPQTAFDPEGVCPEASASATASGTASATPSASATATSTATTSPTATATPTALTDTGGMSLMPVLAAGALALLVAGGLMAVALVRRS
jgi:hypothetical protein